MAFGIDAGMLPHHENWREFPVMVSVRLAIAARADRQHAQALEDVERGIYGEYPPAV